MRERYSCQKRREKKKWGKGGLVGECEGEKMEKSS